MPLFDDQTPEIIHARILKRIKTPLQTREGSYTYEVTAPIAFEIWRLMMTLDELISAFYVDETSGVYLDKHADLLAFARRQGTKAAAKITFTGVSGLVIPAGTAFFTSGGLEFDLMDEVTLTDGTGLGTIEAADIGDKYNVDAGEIKVLLRTILGLTGFACTAAEGGTDEESDFDLYARIKSRRENPSTSGNPAHYTEWALSCNGVGAAKVKSVWAGPGTVKVVLLGYDRRPVDDAVVDACAAYIEEMHPVGANVTVTSASVAEISVSAAVTLNADADLAAVQAEYVSKLDTYFQSLAFESQVVYINRIGALLLEVDGVTDYSGLTANGGTENIEIDDDAVPIVGEVILL